ncbi:aldehyde dehydrogenase family protein, partial [Ruegeria pomeroyi]
MALQQISSFAAGQWVAPGAGARTIASAITGAPIASAGNDALDVLAMLDHARNTGGPALRKLGFHDRARMIKALGQALNARKAELYAASFDTGATQSDHLIDIDGGIGTMFVFASKGRREMPDGQIYLDGEVEQLSRNGTFLGQHVCTPLQGVAVHINAFNFPVWGMLEKLAPTLLAGVPSIVKPATNSCYVTELAVRIMLEAEILPAGALQLVSGGLGDMLDHLDCQDVVSFTGSADTALKLRSNPVILQNSVRFVAEQDSLNASILGPDAEPGTPEFDLFIKEVAREMTTKAGQKCTAIRRIIAPQPRVEAVIEAL